MNSSIKLIDFSRYDRYVREQLSELQAWALSDDGGRLIYATCPEESAQALICQTDIQDCAGEIAINASNNAFLGRLHYRLEHHSDASRAVMQMIADCISKELALQCELDAMAGELTERYEELHLIYDTEDQSASYQECQQALDQLVGNCLGYLEVDRALLWLPEQKITVLHHRPDLPFEYSPPIEGTVKQAILRAVKRDEGAVVINKLAERSDLDLDQRLPGKLLAVPVSGSNGACIGVLALLNGLLKRDFSNSDRSLMEAMARKVSKLVHGSYDELTGLIRRKGFEYYLRQAIGASRYQGLSHSVLCINLDKFSLVNDTLGVEVGDQLLKAVTEVFQHEIRDSDTLARLEGDSFGLLLTSCPQDHARTIAERILVAVRQLRVGQSDAALQVTARIGLGALDADARGVEQLMSSLDVALKVAKEQGGDRVRRSGPGDQEMQSWAKAMRWVARIQGAVRDDRFELFLQPIVALHAGPEGAAHGEFLLRYRGSDGVLVSPQHFMPPAEYYHLMPSVDRWVVKRALAHIADFRMPGCWSINLSGQTLADEGFDQELIQMILDSGVSPDRLCFEVTETSAIGNLQLAQKLIARLRQMGCLFALDDFGTGLSSFTYLRELEVDFVKIDGSFVRHIAEDPVAFSIVKAIHEVAKRMGLKTIAECVEDEGIRAALCQIGVDYAQGYYFGRPESIGDMPS